MQVYDGTPQQTRPFRVAPRLSLRMGRDGRRQDRRPRRRRRLLRSVPGRQHPRSDSSCRRVLNTYRTNYTTINELLTSPADRDADRLTRIDPFTPPVVYNWSLGVQQRRRLRSRRRRGLRRQRARNQLMSYATSTAGPTGTPTSRSSLDSTNVVGGQAQPLAERPPPARTRAGGRSPSASSPGTRTITRCRCR